MNEITNLTNYNDGMRKSLLDKIWFLSKIGPNVTGIYDYGCADGALLQMVHTLMPNKALYGYDFNPEMVALASKNVPEAKIFDAPLIVLKDLVVNASSVFHEIYNYSTNPDEDYKNIFGYGASYIAIRDMFYSETACRPTNPIFLANVYLKEPLEKIKEFESFNGPLTENKNFLHYLLTYRYTDNWYREVRENYFPHSLEQFLNKIPKTYKVVYIEHYILPFLVDTVHRDFGFTIQDATHAKILLEKVG